MKNIKLVVFLSMFLIPLLGTQPAYSDDFMLIATSLCDYTKANDRSKIRKKLKRARLKIRKVYGAVSCNGQSLHQFAVASNAPDVVKFYETKIKANKL